jgi:hypothetical protein
MDNLDRSEVVVMSQKTWDAVSNVYTSIAKDQKDPIAYITRFNALEVVIDDTLPYCKVEVYEKWMYDKITKEESGE